MAKILIKLKEASFLDLYGNQYIMSNRPYVAENTNAIQALCAAGKAEVIAQLKDGAKDEDFEKAIEKDLKKGQEAFLAKFDAKVKGEAQSNPANPANQPAPAANPDKK